jgi:hypothetical protein
MLMSFTEERSMNLLDDLKSYLEYIKKHLLYITGIFAIIEGLIFLKIGTTNIFMTAGSFFIVPFVVVTLFLMFKDIETSILIYSFSMPLIPMVLYLAFRLNINWLGNYMYYLYFGILIFNTYKSMKKGEINIKTVVQNKKYKKLVFLYLVLIVLGLVSSILSIHISESLDFLFLGLISMVIFSLILICFGEAKTELINKLMFYLSTSIVISGIPDALISIYTLIFLNKNIHLYGPLGGNFLLGYTIIVLPILLYNSFNKNYASFERKSYLFLLIVEMVILSTQMSRGILLTLVFIFIFTIIIDRKNFLKYILVSVIVLSCVTFNVLNRWEFDSVKSEIKTEGIQKALGTDSEFLKRLIEQTKSRRPVWGIALEMTADHAAAGVGPGHFKYHYLPYGGDPDRPYTDAHNIILTVLAEMGIIFTSIFFIALSWYMLKALFISFKNKVNAEETKKIMRLIVLGIFSLFIYGNITGQAFMTFVYPVSTAPAFVLTAAVTILVVKLQIAERSSKLGGQNEK